MQLLIYLPNLSKAYNLKLPHSSFRCDLSCFCYIIMKCLTWSASLDVVEIGHCVRPHFGRVTIVITTLFLLNCAIHTIRYRVQSLFIVSACRSITLLTVSMVSFPYILAGGYCSMASQFPRQSFVVIPPRSFSIYELQAWTVVVLWYLSKCHSCALHFLHHFGWNPSRGRRCVSKLGPVNARV